MDCVLPVLFYQISMSSGPGYSMKDFIFLSPGIERLILYDSVSVLSFLP